MREVAKWYLIISIAFGALMVIENFKPDLFISILVSYAFIFADFEGYIHARGLAKFLVIFKLVSTFFKRLSVGYLMDIVGLASILISYWKEEQ